MAVSGGSCSILLGRGGSSWRKMPVKVVLDLYLLAGQNYSSPPDVPGTHIVFAHHVGVSGQNRNRPIRLISQTVVRLVNRLGSLHLIIIP